MINLRKSTIVALAVLIATGSVARAQEAMHEHQIPLGSIDGISDPQKLPTAIRLEYFLLAYRELLNANLSNSDIEIVTHAVEKIHEAAAARNLIAQNEWDFLCRNFEYLDSDSIVQMMIQADNRELERPTSSIRSELTRLSKSGKKLLSEEMSSADYNIQILHGNHAAMSREHPLTFRSNLSNQCSDYLAWMDGQPVVEAQ